MGENKIRRKHELGYKCDKWFNSFISIILTGFCLIEARRFRYYLNSTERVYLLERFFFSQIHTAPENMEWVKEIAESYKYPQPTITKIESFSIRVKRNYSWLYLLLYGCWIFKLSRKKELEYSVNGDAIEIEFWILFCLITIVFLIFIWFIYKKSKSCRN